VAAPSGPSANLPLFLEVLLPLGLSSPILTGADVEQAIEAARSASALGNLRCGRLF
jgi:hypothetical protein